MAANAVRIATCIEVSDEEFDDLCGATGQLYLDPHDTDRAVNWFNGGGGVEMTRKRVIEKDGVVKVFTKLGNTFTFKIVGTTKGN